MARPEVEVERLPLAILEKVSYCTRQAYLVWRERLWADNRFTIEGAHVHQRVVEGFAESRPGAPIERSVRVWSDVLHLVGVADVVEWRAAGPLPVEYKRGGGRRRPSQILQLCLQALCLEEMTGQAVPEGALYHSGTRTRERVVLDDSERAHAIGVLAEARALLAHATPPQAQLGPLCRGCSLKAQCLPKVTRNRRSAGRYLDRALR